MASLKTSSNHSLTNFFIVAGAVKNMDIFFLHSPDTWASLTRDFHDSCEEESGFQTSSHFLRHFPNFDVDILISFVDIPLFHDCNDSTLSRHGETLYASSFFLRERERERACRARERKPPAKSSPRSISHW